MNLLLVAVPRYGAYGMCLTGAILLGASIVYYLMLPKPPLVIVLDGVRLIFHLGWCFWMVLVAGKNDFLVLILKINFFLNYRITLFVHWDDCICHRSYLASSLLNHSRGILRYAI